MINQLVQTRHLSFFNTFQKETNLPLVLGHRGVPEEHQENTMAGFKRAIALGIDGVELDVFLTKDNKLVVFHDLDTESEKKCGKAWKLVRSLPECAPSKS